MMQKQFKNLSIKEKVFQDQDPTLEIIPKEEGSGYPFVRIIFSYFLGGTLLGFLFGLWYCLFTVYPSVGEHYLKSKIYIDLSTMIPVGFIGFFVPAVLLLWIVSFTRWTRSFKNALYSGLIGGVFMAGQIYFYSLMVGKNELDQTVQVVHIQSLHYVVIFVLYALMSGLVAYLAYPRQHHLT